MVAGGVLPGGWWCSNRTFMELKLVKARNINTINISSNRTFMELKFPSAWGTSFGRLF